jgi:pimeloyl-ACP methyl ester carboxylesterase
MNALLAFVSRDASGLAIAALVAALGLVLRALGLPWPVAALPVLAGAVLAALSIRHLLTLARTRAALPPPGRRVDIGGHAVHVWAEGEARAGRPAVVWFAGGHAPGYMLVHLHRAFRGETRSILIDRPGTGWSDAGPFPRTTAGEADEMWRALDAAGERGPFVLAGHSFGGLLAANMARRRPAAVHTLVLLDPTPPETIVFGPRLGALGGMRRNAWRSGWMQLFGIDLRGRQEAAERANPAYARVLDAVERELGDDARRWRAIERRSASGFTSASIFGELTPEGLAARAWDMVVYDRDLGDLPVVLMGPKDDQDGDIASLPEAQAAGEDGAQRMFRFYAATRERYLATSTNSRRIVAPRGAGHNFVYEQPEWTIAALRHVILGEPMPDTGPPAAEQ